MQLLQRRRAGEQGRDRIAENARAENKNQPTPETDTDRVGSHYISCSLPTSRTSRTETVEGPGNEGTSHICHTLHFPSQSKHGEGGEIFARRHGGLAGTYERTNNCSVHDCSFHFSFYWCAYSIRGACCDRWDGHMLSRVGYGIR